MFTEEIKKAVSSPCCSIRTGWMKQSNLFSLSKMNIPMPGTIAGHLLRGVRMILSNWDFLMTVSRPEQPVNR